MAMASAITTVVSAIAGYGKKKKKRKQIFRRSRRLSARFGPSTVKQEWGLVTPDTRAKKDGRQESSAPGLSLPRSFRTPKQQTWTHAHAHAAPGNSIKSPTTIHVSGSRGGQA